MLTDLGSVRFLPSEHEQTCVAPLNNSWRFEDHLVDDSTFRGRGSSKLSYLASQEQRQTERETIRSSFAVFENRFHEINALLPLTYFKSLLSLKKQLVEPTRWQAFFYKQIILLVHQSQINFLLFDVLFGFSRHVFLEWNFSSTLHSVQRVARKTLTHLMQFLKHSRAFSSSFSKQKATPSS